MFLLRQTFANCFHEPLFLGPARDYAVQLKKEKNILLDVSALLTVPS